MKLHEHAPLIQTVEKFARSVGLTPETIRIWIRNNHLPSIKIGKRRLVNTHKYSKMLEGED